MADIKLSPRMKNWISGLGGHIATSTSDGVPTVIVADSAIAEGDRILRFPLTDKQLAYVKGNIASNPKVAIGPGGIGSIRAAYQFKGLAEIKGNELVVTVDEIYCTKPGPEAGLRLDGLGSDDVVKFEKSRWQDDGPPKK